MTQLPERKEQEELDNKPQLQDVQVRPTVPEIPEHIEKGGYVQNHAANQQFTAKVQDDQGNHLIFTPETKQEDVFIPEPEYVLIEKAKGSVDESSTWSANFFLRIIKKAIHFGRKLVWGNTTGDQLVSNTNEV